MHHIASEPPAWPSKHGAWLTRSRHFCLSLHVSTQSILCQRKDGHSRLDSPLTMDGDINTMFCACAKSVLMTLAGFKP